MIERLPTPAGSSGSALRPTTRDQAVSRVFEKTARPARLPFLRQRRGRPRRQPRGAPSSLRRRDLRGGPRRHDRRLGIPGEDLPDRGRPSSRRLVQRPPRLPNLFRWSPNPTTSGRIHFGQQPGDGLWKIIAIIAFNPFIWLNAFCTALLSIIVFAVFLDEMH